MKLRLTILGICSLASFASATVTLDFQMGTALTSASTPVAVGTIGILVADNNGTGLPTAADLVGATLSAGSLIGDSQILGVMQAQDFTGAPNHLPAFAGFFNGINLTGGLVGGAGTAGTDLAIYWFPGITTIGATVTNGQSYGFYRSDVIDGPSGGNFSFNLPPDSNTASIYALTADQGGGLSNTSFVANGIATSAAPEPSRVLLGAMGLGAFLMRRRRAA